MCPSRQHPLPALFYLKSYAGAVIMTSLAREWRRKAFSTAGMQPLVPEARDIFGSSLLYTLPFYLEHLATLAHLSCAPDVGFVSEYLLKQELLDFALSRTNSFQRGLYVQLMTGAPIHIPF